MTDHSEHRAAAPDAGRPVSVSHLFHTLRAYTPVMLLALAAVMIGYLLIAVTVYLLGPSQRMTSLPFRLDFEGASKGEYPNGRKFSPADIVAAPILLRVFNDNNLGKYSSFPAFSRSVFVLETNSAYEVLYADYQARLSDPRLTPLDRERLNAEFNLKRESLSKNEYSIYYTRNADTGVMPENIVRKVLRDVLTTWADVAVHEQHVTFYQVPVLSPAFFDPTEAEKSDPFVAVHMLRGKALRVMENIDSLRALPAGDLARSEHEHLSLAEIRARIEDIVRYSLEPLVPALRPTPSTARFLEAQLAYDQRMMASYKQRLDSMREAISVYMAEPSQRPSTTTAAIPQPSATANGLNRQGGDAGNETVMPQLSDSFLDRLVSLAKNSADVEYRQKLSENYGVIALGMIPSEDAVAWDTHALNLVKTNAGTMDAAAAQAQIEATREQLRRLVVTENDIYQMISRNLSPATELFAYAGVPTTRVERARSIRRLALLGFLVFLASIPAIVIAALLHNRMKEEERDEAYAMAHADTVAS